MVGCLASAQRRTVHASLVLALFVLGCAPHAEVALRFRALVGQRAFASGQRYEGLGKNPEALTFSDLRLYVAQPRLIDARGAQHALTLKGDAQASDHLALLDFGRAATRTLHASVSGLDLKQVSGIAFEVGVPFAENHQDVSIAPPPLDVSSMFWVWRHGYKFLRLEAESGQGATKQPVSVHLGSTGCTGRAPTDPPERCTQPNRVQVRLMQFDPARDTIDLDLAALLASLTFSAHDASAGCESAPDDPDCVGIFAALGLVDTTPQHVFRVGKAAP
jgi:uncharacterized repeat protein (TIGR04052 family)